MRHSTIYTVGFAALICVFCGVFVSYAAVSLRERQVVNAELDKKKKVLEAAGLTQSGEDVTPERVTELFENIEPVAVDLRSGKEDPNVDTDTYDQEKAAGDPSQSFEAEPNPSAVQRIPNWAQVYKVYNDAGELEMLVLPIEGLGLWGTLYGFLALDSDLETVRGLTYYRHKETPGLGGEVENPRWRNKWPNRRLFDEEGEPALRVIKGAAPPPEEAPYQVDGLSGATITANGVTNMLRFWFDQELYGQYLDNLAAGNA